MHQLTDPFSNPRIGFSGEKKTKTFCFDRAFRIFSILIFFLTVSSLCYSQGIVPTKGKDFWIGFPVNPQFSNSLGTKRCEVFVTSNVNTTGTISIPLQSWSQSFTVIANQTTTISLSVPQVEHTSSQVADNKGIQILTQDTVSAFAISFQAYTADATIIYPKQSLGTEYRISSYKGISSSNPPNLNSHFLVVATENGTQISITPSVQTLAGSAAGVPFIINLNAGESYQVRAFSDLLDLSGSVIKATDTSGSCRPFAVFSGSACTRVPANCAACDVLYDQAIPVSHWGKNYYAVPFALTTSYTLRIMADQNATSYTLNGGAPVVLNAGQYTEINSISGTSCVIATKPISVIQYMEGVTCAGAGDPAMMYLNSQDQKIDQVTFSTVTSAVITQHNVNVIMSTSHIGQLRLDGLPVPIASFAPLNSCPLVSYARLPLTQGSHTLEADSGFAAYVYGTGSAESYAYSAGSFSKTPPILVDSILCANDTVRIGTTAALFSSWWSTATNPNDTIGTGPVLTLLPPVNPDIYIQHGNHFISGCEQTYYFAVDVPNPPQTYINSISTIACVNQLIQINSGTIPPSSLYQYAWSPTVGLNNANIPNPVVTASTSMWYYLTVTSINGCAFPAYDSIYIDVLPLPLPIADAGPDQTICRGNTAILNANGGVSYLWNPGGIAGTPLMVSPLATTDYILFATDFNGCQGTDTVRVFVTSSPVVDAGAGQGICEGTSATLSATALPGLSYLWTPGGDTNSTVMVTPSQTTTFTVQVTNLFGCSGSDTVTVIVDPMPVIVAGPDTILCPGGTAMLIASGGVSYLWNPGGMTTDTVFVTPVSTASYSVQVSGPNGCPGIDTVYVTVSPLPVPNFSTPSSICQNNSLNFINNSTVGIGSIASCNWSFGDGVYSNVDNPVHTYSSSGNFTVSLMATSSIGCRDSITRVITVLPEPSPDFSTQNVCPGIPRLFSDLSVVASGNIIQWLWNFGDGSSGTQQNPLHSYAQEGLYDVQLSVTSNSGCTSTKLFPGAILVYPSPNAQFISTPSFTTILNPFVKFTDLSNNGIIWQWNFGDNSGESQMQNPTYIYKDTGTYTVSMITSNAYGCIDTSYGVVFIRPEFTVYIPNTFSPNGDGKNDFFIPSGIGIINIEMDIFDRWGKMIFRSSHISQAWNGTIDGNPCMQGVYVYKIKVTDFNFISYDYVGQVNIIR